MFRNVFNRCRNRPISRVCTPPRTPPKSLGLRKTTRFLKTVGRQFHSSQGPDAIVLKVPRL